MLVFDIYQKLRSEGNLIKDPFQLLPGSTRGTYSQSVLEKKKDATDLYKYQQKQTLLPYSPHFGSKILGKNRIICFFLEGIKKSTWKTSRIFPKKPPQTSPISAVAWLVADQRTSLCGIVRLFGNKILLPKRAIWLATLGPQTLRGSMFWEKKECVCQKSLRDF